MGKLEITEITDTFHRVIRENGRTALSQVIIPK